MKLYKIKKSNIDKNGRGLYATKNIKVGTKIIEYVGNIITKKQTEDSDKFDNSKPIYLFNLNKRYDLDGDVSWNTARLINHSCSNNCEYDGTGLKIWVVSSKEIKKGEELTCDYGFGFDSDFSCCLGCSFSPQPTTSRAKNSGRRNRTLTPLPYASPQGTGHCKMALYL